MPIGEDVGRLGPTSELSSNRVKATGSTTARSLAARAADVLNAKDFGGVGRMGSRPRAGAPRSQSTVVAARWPLDQKGNASVPTGLSYARTGTMYVPVNGGVSLVDANNLPVSDMGLFVETSQTNLLTYSENFDDVSWVAANSGASNPVVTSNVRLSPAFTPTVDSIALPAIAGSGQYATLSKSFTAAAQPHVYSLWVRKASGTGSTVYLTIHDGVSVAYTTLVNLNTGTMQRVSLTTPNLTAATWYVQIGPDGRAWSGQPTTQSSITVEVWGAHVTRPGSATATWYAQAYVPGQFSTPGATGTMGGASATFTTPLTTADGTWGFSVLAQPLGGLHWAALDCYMVKSGTLAAASSWNLRSFTDGAIYFDVYDASAQLRRMKATHGFGAGSQHRITVTNASGVLAIYLDGTLAAGTGSGSGTGVLGAHSNVVMDSTTTLHRFAVRDVAFLRTSDGAHYWPRTERALVLGDSISAGASAAWTTNLLAQAVPWPQAWGDATGRCVYNRAVPGWTAANITARWTASDRGGKEDLVVVMGGTNDMLAGTAAASVMATLETIFTQAISDSQFVVVVSVLPLWGASGWTPTKQANLEELNRLMRTWVAAQSGQAVYVDAYASMADVNGQLITRFNAGDQIHLTQIGADYVAGLVADAIP